MIVCLHVFTKRQLGLTQTGGT